jgi:hypothetical protein
VATEDGQADDPGPEVGYTGARFGGAPRRKARKRVAREGADTGSAGRAPVDARTVILPAVTGSGGPGAAADTAADPAADTAADDPVVGYTGARFGGTPRRGSKVPAAEPAPAAPAPAPPARPEPDPLYYEDPASSFVRPYVFTGGRTRSQFELSLETLVSAVPGRATRLGGEHAAVVELCREPRSVAEVAALLAVPLGVARVLVGDLAGAGDVAVHRSVGTGGPDLALMERVLGGLRRL